MGFFRIGVFCIFTAAIPLGLTAGCTNKTALGDRPGYQEIDTVEAIAEAKKAVQWVEIDLNDYSPNTPEAVAARDGVVVQWGRVRDRAAELQARLDGMSAERWSGRDPHVTTDFYQTSEERAAVLRQETARLMDMWTALNETYRTSEQGVGSRPRGS